MSRTLASPLASVLGLEGRAWRFGIGVLCLAGACLAQVSGQQAVFNRTPAYIEFSNLQYEAAADASNAVITVVRTGEFRELATVDYATKDGTATAGEDYTAATGTLVIPAGVGFVTFTVPILPGAARSTGKTVLLSLSNPGFNTMITRGEATLTFVEPAAAPASVEIRISLRPQPDDRGEVAVTWPSTTDGFALQWTDDPTSSSWTTVNAAPEIRGGQCILIEPARSERSFYRLRMGVESGAKRGR